MKQTTSDNHLLLLNSILTLDTFMCLISNPTKSQTFSELVLLTKTRLLSLRLSNSCLCSASLTNLWGFYFYAQIKFYPYLLCASDVTSLANVSLEMSETHFGFLIAMGEGCNDRTLLAGSLGHFCSSEWSELHCLCSVLYTNANFNAVVCFYCHWWCVFIVHCSC